MIQSPILSARSLPTRDLIPARDTFPPPNSGDLLDLLLRLIAENGTGDYICAATVDLAQYLHTTAQAARHRLARLERLQQVTTMPCHCAARPYTHARISVAQRIPVSGKLAVSLASVALAPARVQRSRSRVYADSLNQFLAELRRRAGPYTSVCLYQRRWGADLSRDEIRTRFRRLEASGMVRCDDCTCTGLPRHHTRVTLLPASGHVGVDAPPPPQAPAQPEGGVRQAVLELLQAWPDNELTVRDVLAALPGEPKRLAVRDALRALHRAGMVVRSEDVAERAVYWSLAPR